MQSDFDVVIILLGLEHQVLLHCCDCEPDMVRARMWPASPQFPRLAFSFEMMDWVEALLLECPVAVKEFCALGALMSLERYNVLYSIAVYSVHCIIGFRENIYIIFDD